MNNSEIGGLILLLDTVLAPLSVVICFVLLWSISTKLQVMIDILRKMEQTKIKFFDDAHNK